MDVKGVLEMDNCDNCDLRHNRNLVVKNNGLVFSLTCDAPAVNLRQTTETFLRPWMCLKTSLSRSCRSVSQDLTVRCQQRNSLNRNENFNPRPNVAVVARTNPATNLEKHCNT